MKKLTTLLLVLATSFTYAQTAFSGKGDKKINIGANIQDGGSGIQGSADFGLGENFSFGFVANYLLGADDYFGEKPDFGDRFDAKVRVNANLSSVLNISDAFDLYPGLSLGLRNFGGHVGARYFFTDGFGLFSEIGFPIARYDNDPYGPKYLNNQFTFAVGASFNLN
ncbi:DUF6646 family protein [Flavobacterium agrisoli]|uniref:Outer membrane protein with beta-barrel domain n=1 Tax=Flavobacterium agrisoli TaxID=2793066 RepID=A0A934UIY0_9FLAO|nr:DUF6646 family protein [Flavobacterium agrisoli]MBK0369332.1 hypothetical protein [Flavobacterium agrisoli]